MAITELMRTLTLPPGATKSVILTFKIPLVVPTGLYFPAVLISNNADTTNAIGLTQFTIT